MDAAILKIASFEGADLLVRSECLPILNDPYLLAGYPAVRAESPHEFRLDNLLVREHRVDGLWEAQTSDLLSYEVIQGQSGGGIVKIFGEVPMIVGVQSRIPAEQEDKVHN